MARKRSGDRILGPYRHVVEGHVYFRIVRISDDGRRKNSLYKSEAEAEECKQEQLAVIGAEEGALPIFTIPPRCSRGGFVYFVQMDAPGFPTKIGIAQDIRQRLQTIQTHCPYRVTLVAYCWKDNAKQEEGRLHRRFTAVRMRGEWFAFKPELAEAVRVVNATRSSDANGPL
jgi:hypothetical protein